LGGGCGCVGPMPLLQVALQLTSPYISFGMDEFAIVQHYSLWAGSQ